MSQPSPAPSVQNHQYAYPTDLMREAMPVPCTRSESFEKELSSSLSGMSGLCAHKVQHFCPICSQLILNWTVWRVTSYYCFGATGCPWLQRGDYAGFHLAWPVQDSLPIQLSFCWFTHGYHTSSQTPTTSSHQVGQRWPWCLHSWNFQQMGQKHTPSEEVNTTLFVGRLLHNVNFRKSFPLALCNLVSRPETV